MLVNLPTPRLLAAFLLFVTCLSCQDPLNEFADAKGASAAKPQKLIGNGLETIIANKTVQLYADTLYVLSGIVRVRQNAVLNIAPGTVIVGQPGYLPGTLIIERSAKIQAIGTPSAPIVFTSALPPGSRHPGDWGGLIICGRGYVNVETDVYVPTFGSLAFADSIPPSSTPPDDPPPPPPANLRYEGYVEGLPATIGPIPYGGQSSNPTVNYNDNSGTLAFVRIEYAGTVLSEGNETNGLTLCAVGAGTTIHHVQVSFSADDGFQWFGGSVDQKYLISYRNTDDDFDTDHGYFGRAQFGYAVRDPLLSVQGSRAFESKGNDDNAANLNESVFSDPAYSNFTVIGPIPPDNTFAINGLTETFCGFDWAPYANYGDAIHISNESQLDLANSVVTGFPRYAAFMEDPTDYVAGGIPSAYVIRNRLVYDRIVNPVNTASNIPTNTIQINNELRAATGCDNPAVDVAGKAGLRRSAWRIPDTPFEPKPSFTIVNTSPLNGNIPAERAQFTSTRFVNFNGNFYKGIQNNNAFWDKTVLFRGAAGVDEGNWELSSGWVQWTPNLIDYN